MADIVTYNFDMDWKQTSDGPKGIITETESFGQRRKPESKLKSADHKMLYMPNSL